MHIMRNISVLLLSSILMLSVGCITKVEERDSAPSGSNAFTISAVADSGATISPSSISVSSGERPKFTIHLKSGYKIDTVLCWVGGALTRNDDNTYTFTMAPVDRSETVSVRTIRTSGVAILQDESRFEAIPYENGVLRFAGTGTILDHAEIVLEPVYREGELVFEHRVRFPQTGISVDDQSVSVITHEALGYTDIVIPSNHIDAVRISVSADGKTYMFFVKFLTE